MIVIVVTFRFLKKWIVFPFIIFMLITAQINSFCQGTFDGTGIADLKSSIENVLKETRTPGAGVAIVTKDGPLWIGGLGKPNIEKNINANENTLFRLASTSKMFVALSILKLQEEGKLDLNDKVRDHVPDLEFHNPWEDTHPVRIVHLLEHTTGWDEYHLVEQTCVSLTLKEGLDFHPHSRRSRWIPGTRMAYCNSSSAVAAFIVERITGQQYEAYVEENFFRPLNMRHTTFFNDERHQKWGATLYDKNLRPLPYRHVIQRPAGAIHSSALEMANFVRFLLNRGAVDTLQLISEESISRMEISKSTAGAEAGLELGYGLANFTSVHNGFIYQGHNGGMPGAGSELAYLPEHGIGHAFFINSANGNAFYQISKLIRDFETRALERNTVLKMSGYSEDFTFPSGYYFPINPRHQSGYFFDRLFDVFEFKKVGDRLEKSWILHGGKQIFYPVSDSRFRTGASDKIALVRAVDPLEGQVLYTDSRVYKPVSSFVAYGQISILVLWIAMMGVGSLCWVISLARSWAGKSGEALKITQYPMMATLMFGFAAFGLIFSQRHYNEFLTSPGILSITLLAFSIWFALSALWSLVIIFRSRKSKTGKVMFWSMAILSCLHVTVMIYLVWFDVIPVITWK